MTDNRPKNVPICVDCKHSHGEPDKLKLKCWKEQPTKDIITGKDRLPLCVEMRSDPDRCGWEAKFFAAKPNAKPVPTNS